jgi:hypothetical protein
MESPAFDSRACHLGHLDHRPHRWELRAISTAERPSWPQRPRSRLLECCPLHKNSLYGFVFVQFASGLIVAEIAVHVEGERPWASPISRQWVKDRESVPDDQGNPNCQQLIGVRYARRAIVVVAAHNHGSARGTPNALVEISDDHGRKMRLP